MRPLSLVWSPRLVLYDVTGDRESIDTSPASQKDVRTDPLRRRRCCCIDTCLPASSPPLLPRPRPAALDYCGWPWPRSRYSAGTGHYVLYATTEWSGWRSATQDPSALPWGFCIVRPVAVVRSLSTHPAYLKISSCGHYPHARCV